ncbi:STAS domain-containing protein [Leptolyngbya sp. FACHB-261]|uniref:STAS domain-containing protein n=1 Tax=Leptolyngbya sp. FACHB-261 TaxID=2692806 RepID=UPI00168392A2|nr:STAS domain-containing protein [Leptolyngbya sp. FACHB-261]MBD2102699.1 STAS domain-containing protein [Leptolyngbya sp. FACHB-261]
MLCEVSCLRGEVARQHYEIIVLSPRGKMCSLEAVYFGRELQEAGKGRYPHLLVDMSRVTSIDSCGVGALVASQRIAKAHRVRLALASLQRDVQPVMKLMDINKLIEIYDAPDQFVKVVQSSLQTHPSPTHPFGSDLGVNGLTVNGTQPSLNRKRLTLEPTDHLDLDSGKTASAQTRIDPHKAPLHLDNQRLSAHSLDQWQFEPFSLEQSVPQRPV